MAEPRNAGILVPGMAVKHLLMHLRKYQVSNQAQLIQLAVTQKWALLFANYCSNVSLHKSLSMLPILQGWFFFFFPRAVKLSYFISEIHWGLTNAGEMYKGNNHTVQSASQPGKSCYHLMHVIGTRQRVCQITLELCMGISELAELLWN